MGDNSRITVKQLTRFRKKQLEGIKSTTSGSVTDLIWHVYTWESSASWAGISATYSIVDNESSFSGILAVKFRNNADGSTTSGDVKWIAASKTPPKACITKILNDDGITATYHLFIYYGGTWRTPTITELHINTQGTITKATINTQVTELIGAELYSSDKISVDYATDANNALSASEAVKLSTARNININGTVVGTGSFDGSDDVDINVKLEEIIPIENGGTGAIDATGAITNLGAVDLTSDQTVTGTKTFENGIQIGEASITYDAENKRIVFAFPE